MSLQNIIHQGPSRKWLNVVVMSLALCGSGSAGAGSPLPSPLDRPALMTHSAQTEPFITAASLPGGDAFVAGVRGIVMRKSEDESLWTQVPMPVSVTLTAMTFQDDMNGYAVGHGGVILRTRDSGKTWALLRDGRNAAVALREHFSRDESLPDWASDWEEILASEATGQPLLDVCIVQEGRTIFASGAFGQLWRSQDEGKTWKPIFNHLPVEERYHLYGLSCDQEVIVIGAEFGRIYRSTDSGETFIAIDSGVDGTIFGLQAAKDGTLIAYGLRGLVLRSTDRGLTWNAFPTPVNSTLVASTVNSKGDLLLLSREGEILTAPPGWKELSLLQTVAGGPFNDISILNDSSLLLASSSGPLQIPLSRETPHD